MTAASQFLRSEKRIGFSVFVIVCFLSLIAVSGADDGIGLSEGSSGSAGVPDVIFFYGDGCVHCEKIRPVVDDLADRHALNIQYLEVYHNATNQEYVQRVFASHNMTPMIPALIIGDAILVGEIQIQDGAEELITRMEQGTRGQNTTTNPGNGTVGTDLTLPLVISAALVDSVNPCAFAVLVFLLLSIITLQSRRRVLTVGGIYIGAVFSFYLLSGIGLFAIVQGSGFSSVLYYGAAFLSIILGLVNITDVIRKNEGFILAIPESKKGVIDQYINTASLPAAFVLGILVGIFELPCTGGIYLAILSMMSRNMTFAAGLPYLLLYNLIFVLPLIIILLIVTFGLSPERVHLWRLENRRLLRFIIGIAMVAIGAVMLAGIV